VHQGELYAGVAKYRLAGSAETGRGSGLGLALVRQIARHHGGDVQCRAAEGGGSVFSIVIPASESTAKLLT